VKYYQELDNGFFDVKWFIHRYIYDKYATRSKSLSYRKERGLK